jgi:transcriptional regulator with XRE-family HTH domain
MTYQFLENQNSYFRVYLGKYLRHKRQNARLSQDDIAQQLGLTKAGYQRIENGRAKVSEELFEKLSPKLEVNMSEIVELINIAKIAYANGVAKELSGNYPL